MKTILGIGTAGSNLARRMKEYNKEYQIYTISNKNERNTKFNFKLEEYDHPEKYEQLNVSKINKFLSNIKFELTVFICGASFTSGLALKILKPVFDRDVITNIVYITPELDILNETAFRQEKLVRNVLQEYTRSGLFAGITLIENTMLEGIVGETTVFDYYNKINTAAASTLYMLDVLKNSAPISSTFSKVIESCRINTVGITELDSETEKMFFSLENEVEVLYYFGINEEKLKTEKNLFRKITNMVKSRKKEGTKVSFAIYPTNYENDYIYIEFYSPKIQNFI